MTTGIFEDLVAEVSLLVVLLGVLLRVVPRTRRWAPRQRRLVRRPTAAAGALPVSGHPQPRDPAELHSRTVEGRLTVRTVEPGRQRRVWR